MSENHDENLREPSSIDDVHQQTQRPLVGAAGWVASAAMHATVMMLMGTVYFLTRPEEPETPPLRMTEIPPPPQRQVDKPRITDLDTKQLPIDIQVTDAVDVPQPITSMELPVEETAREENLESKAPRGREEAVADMEAGSQGAFMAIGMGNSGSGMLGCRTGDGKRRAMGQTGCSKGAVVAVDGSLRWLKKHQSASGAWEGDNYFKNCTDDPKCEPGSLEKWGPEQVNTALTGYALMCYLGAGYDHKTPGKFQPTVKRGVNYLLSIQAPDGMLGKRNYEHAIATKALAEAYGMTNDPDLRAPAQKAVDRMLREQNLDPAAADKEYAGLGWNYNGPGTRNDSSVTGWNIMALKSAYASGLNVGQGVEGAKRWLDATWKAANPGWDKLDPYQGRSVFPYVWTTGETTLKENARGRECIGMVSAVFLGHKAGDTMLETLANTVMATQVPKAYPTNTYYLYYNTMGIFQVGGEKWQVWNSQVRDMLVDAQRRDEGCLNGSWDWQGTGFHGHEIGRVLSTVYNCLCLEVYYIYARVNGQATPAR